MNYSKKLLGCTLILLSLATCFSLKGQSIQKQHVKVMFVGSEPDMPLPEDVMSPAGAWVEPLVESLLDNPGKP